MSDERACPPQTLLGSMESSFCVLVHMAMCLEEWIKRGNSAAGHEQAHPFTSNPNHSKNWLPLVLVMIVGLIAVVILSVMFGRNTSNNTSVGAIKIHAMARSES